MVAPVSDGIVTGSGDNGKELIRRRNISKALGADWFSAHPHHLLRGGE